ncbi:MAG: hypothetical protein ACRETS_10735 [Steroidobacteraceae bacterium]
MAPAAAAKPADSADEQEEKRLLSEGYRKEMRHGSVYFCRRQEVLGSRLGGELVCGTPQELRAAEAQAREMVERAQRQQTNPTVH